MKKLLTLLIIVFFTQNCKSKKIEQPKSDNRTQEIKYLIKGDPRAVIAGALLNQKSFITNKNFTQFDNFVLTSVVSFESKTVIENPNRTSSEEGNEAQSSDESAQESHVYEFHQKGDGKFLFYNKKYNYLDFEFESNLAGELELVNLISKNEKYPIQTLHYSLKMDNNSFSILVFHDSDSIQEIASFTFVKQGAEKLTNVNSSYNYLSGPGVRNRWTEAIKLNICSKNTTSDFNLKDDLSKSQKVWSDGTPKLPSNSPIQHLQSYPPFSDLNSQCVYLVNSYRTAEDGFLNPASTLSLRDNSRSKLIDGDLFYFTVEIEKYKNMYIFSSARFLEKIYQVTLHEYGHFLGLDHQFDVPSVMGYGNATNYLSAYDLEAINALYD